MYTLNEQSSSFLKNKILAENFKSARDSTSFSHRNRENRIFRLFFVFLCSMTIRPFFIDFVMNFYAKSFCLTVKTIDWGFLKKVQKFVPSVQIFVPRVQIFVPQVQIFVPLVQIFVPALKSLNLQYF